MTRVETVSIIYQPPRVLLAMKKKRLGKDKYNGFGGGVENGETLEECVVRETFEEAGIRIMNPERMGRILFQFQTNEQDHLVHFFKATEYLGIPKESDEMKPEWFNEKQIPYDKMWADDRYWLPMLLAGKKFIGKFIFNAEEENGIDSYEINEVSSLV